jgi:hypothetical protein
LVIIWEWLAYHTRDGDMEAVRNVDPRMMDLDMAAKQTGQAVSYSMTDDGRAVEGDFFGGLSGRQWDRR